MHGASFHPGQKTHGLIVNTFAITLEFIIVCMRGHGLGGGKKYHFGATCEVYWIPSLTSTPSSCRVFSHKAKTHWHDKQLGQVMHIQIPPVRSLLSPSYLIPWLSAKTGWGRRWVKNGKHSSCSGQEAKGWPSIRQEMGEGIQSMRLAIRCNPWLQTPSGARELD